MLVPVSNVLGPTNNPKCPKCKQSLGNNTVTGSAPPIYNCANCKERFGFSYYSSLFVNVHDYPNESATIFLTQFFVDYKRFPVVQELRINERISSPYNVDGLQGIRHFDLCVELQYDDKAMAFVFKSGVGVINLDIAKSLTSGWAFDFHAKQTLKESKE